MVGERKGDSFDHYFRAEIDIQQSGERRIFFRSSLLRATRRFG